MSTPIPGKLSKLDVSNDGGNTWTPVLGRVDMELSLQKGEIDASHMDSEDWSDYLHGRKSATINFTLRALPDDPGQDMLIKNYFASQLDETLLDIRFRQRIGAGEQEFLAKGFVTSLTIRAADEAPQDITGAIRISGPVTPADQEA